MRHSALTTATALAIACLAALGAGAEEIIGEELLDEPCEAAAATTFRWRGRVDTDAIATAQGAANLATFGDLGNVVGLRRARIGVEGELAIGGRYIGEIDLASGEVVIRDLFVGLGEIQAPGEWRGGHYREPFSLEMATGANFLRFWSARRSTFSIPREAGAWDCFAPTIAAHGASACIAMAPTPTTFRAATAAPSA